MRRGPSSLVDRLLLLSLLEIAPFVDGSNHIISTTMFDISWAELGVLTAVGIAVVGRKDLPLAARTAGHYTGRCVGWLQGMRTRADRFTAQNELAHLQGEVRSSMRQLQAVQAEVLSASSVQGGLSGGLSQPPRPPGMSSPPSSTSYSNPNMGSSPVSNLKPTTAALPTMTTPQTATTDPATSTATTPKADLPPPSRTIAAVAETEWARQGLGFTSRAERMGSPQNNNAEESSSPPGSVLLAKALQESLVYDQYDRVTQEQQEALHPSEETETKKTD